jgi:2',3'-cyclic-nucleotide 2'-phosphodiesterase (5'-nucleotidase family)
MSGKDMSGLFDYYVQYEKNNPVSHLYIETEGKKLKNGLINGKTVDVNKTYYIATSDYLAQGGDNMKFFSKGEVITTGLRMRDVFMEYFKKNPEIKTSSEIRLNFIGKTNE